MLKTSNLLNVYTYYFLILAVSTIVQTVTGRGYIISILYPLLSFVLAVKCGVGRKSIFDVIFLLIIISMLFSWITNSYRNQQILIFRCVMAEGSYMIAYFIGKKYGEYCLDAIYRKASMSLVICCLLGLYFFFRPPVWYLNQLYESDNYTGGILALERLRLRSIFTSPYVMSYMCSLTLIWVYNKLFKMKESDKNLYFFIILMVVTMIFCMMRAPLSCALLSFIIFLFYHCFYESSMKIFIQALISVVLLYFCVIFILQNIDISVLDFVMDKFETTTSGRNELISDRVSLWTYKYGIFGDGAGRHALLVEKFNPSTCISDSEYVKILVEQGYIGLALYVVLISFGVIKSIRYFKYMPIEFCTIVFYSITMIGANSISTVDKHCFIFWITIGRIASFQKSKYRIVNNIK